MAEEIKINEDQIDLKELFNTVWKNKFKIIVFSVIVVSITLFNVLSKPNVYKSSVLLAPQEESKTSSLGGLSALAGLAGVSVGGGSGMDAITSLTTVIHDYSFNEYVIKKYKLDEKFKDPALKENYVFALGFRGVFDFLNNGEEDIQDKVIDKNMVIFDTYKIITAMININADKKTSLITISVEHSDRFFAKYLLEIYLKEAIDYIRKSDMIDLEKKLEYYNNELQNTQDIELKSQLSELMSGLLQKKVLSKASEFYIVKKVVEPRVANIKEKIKPKRGIVVIVSFLGSIILGIFGVFLLEFLRKNKQKD